MPDLPVYRNRQLLLDGEFLLAEILFFQLNFARSAMNDNAMIEVKNLTKRYAGRTAVAGISFTVARGEIVGLLGPNGAGKSTTMRILACYLPATSGTVRVAGFDVFHQSDEVRRRIGYMPENNPLYSEMRVREYLKFRARLKGSGLAAFPRTREHGDGAMRIDRREPPHHRATLERLPAARGHGGRAGARSGIDHSG